VKLVKKTGESRVVVGPATVLLDYDELPQVLSLSRGKPKVDANIFKTVYLRVTANKVSDIVQVETKDLCRLNVTLSYRVSFESDTAKWFDLDNYVKFMTDHLRSKLRNAIKKYGVEEFYQGSADIIRDMVLGAAVEGKTRSGMVFPENGMKIYDVEILNVTMDDKDVEKMLISTQRDVINQTLILQQQRRSLTHSKEVEDIRQQIITLEMSTRETENVARLAELQRKLTVDMAAVDVKNKVVEAQQEFDLASQEVSNKIQQAGLLRERAVKELALELNAASQKQQLEKLTAEVEAVVNKTKAITPDLIAALQAFGDKALLEKIAESMNVMSIIGNKTVVGALQDALGGTRIADALSTLVAPAAAAKALTDKHSLSK
jgi:major vault protein